jgi:hypothetical protein
MKLLLDTHAFLWFIGGDKRLSPSARVLIEDVSNDAYLSVASLWEMNMRFQPTASLACARFAAAEARAVGRLKNSCASCICLHFYPTC